jgi:hypothetical protein
MYLKKMIPAIYNFKKHASGSTFEKVNFVLEVNKRRKSLVGASIVMTLTYLTNTYTFSDGAGFTITDAERGEFCFDRQIITLTAANYQYDITITFDDGSVKKYIKGNWRIV